MQWQVDQVLKSDSFGRVEQLVDEAGQRLLRRVACGASIPGSGLVAKYLMARERAALSVLDGQWGVPRLSTDEGAARTPGTDGYSPHFREILLREWIDGEALHQATQLPEDFFDHLDDLVAALHQAGVCHNDLHKEMNIMVGRDGFPHLIDFQLASVHRGRGRTFQSRCRDDLRHVQKHRRRYTRDGRGPQSRAIPGQDFDQGRGHGIRRSGVARVWRRTGKPLYNFVTRRVLGTSDGEARRPNEGPWPRWTEPKGPRPIEGG